MLIRAQIADETSAPSDRQALNIGPELQRIYQDRFAATRQYRDKIWEVLTADFFSYYISEEDIILDLGSGYGEFINHIRWKVRDSCLDVVFSSNFFEHLPSKSALSETLAQAWRCLRPGGKLIAMGPNIRFLPGRYWDFWDHQIPLTHLALLEVLRLRGFKPVKVFDRFLPYTLINTRPYPLLFLRIYLKLPFMFRFFGKQFLVIVQKLGQTRIPDSDRPVQARPVTE
ncbi:MAG: class I SAM-dependent methyltransferase [Verrucomicrobia bacterium]|nr:MAG: class I SAM-dependent methyltransferase [Verrucomicrobiota bacterium]